MPDAFPGFYRQRLFADSDMCAVDTRGLIDLGMSGAFLDVAVGVRSTGEDPVDTWLNATPVGQHHSPETNL